MSSPGWAIARAVSFLMYYSGGLAVFERLDRGARPAPRCTVLNYHRVADEQPGYRDIAVSPLTFRRHIEYLMRRGLRFLSLTQYHEYLSGERALERDSVVITFDDGYRDNHAAALPVLREFGVPAALFLCTGPIETGTPLWWDRAASALVAFRDARAAAPSGAGMPAAITAAVHVARTGNNREASAAIGRAIDVLKPMPHAERDAVLDALERASSAVPRADLMLTWDLVRDMYRSGVEIGAHSVSHPAFSELDLAGATEEIVGSKRAIEDHIGAAVTAFAYPFGKADFYDASTMAALRASGLQWAYTTENGWNEPGADPYALKRDGMRDVPPYVLAVRLSGLFEHPALGRLRAMLERRPSRSE